jgi:predicted dinucleotide-binding enzyme
VLSAGHVVAEVKFDQEAVKQVRSTRFVLPFHTSPAPHPFPSTRPLTPSSRAQAQVVILALPSPQTISSVHSMSSIFASSLDANTVVIDLTNPLTSRLDLAHEFVRNGTSVAEEFAKILPQNVRVVKALNSIGAQHYGHPSFGGHGVVVDGFWAGPSPSSDPETTSLVETVIRDAGFHPRWVGPLRYARNLESLAELWVGMAYQTKAHGGDDAFAFSLLDDGKERVRGGGEGKGEGESHHHAAHSSAAGAGTGGSKGK